MATHSSVLAWRIPWMGEPVGLPSMGSHRVGHDWSDLKLIRTYCIAQGTLLSTQWSTWEKNLKKSGYMYNWFTLLYSRNSHHIVINYIPIFFLKTKEGRNICIFSECKIQNEVRFCLIPKVTWVRCSFILMKEHALMFAILATFRSMQCH